MPTLSLSWFDFGVGPGGDSDIVIENPMTDLRRDLTSSSSNSVSRAS